MRVRWLTANGWTSGEVGRDAEGRLVVWTDKEHRRCLPASLLSRVPSFEEIDDDGDDTDRH